MGYDCAPPRSFCSAIGQASGLLNEYRGIIRNKSSLRAAHNRLRIAEKREEERAAAAPSKTRAQAVGRSPTFSPCGHFWRHLLVTKGGKSAPRRKRRIEGRDASRRIDRKIFLLSKFFFCAFGLIQKHQKIKHRENSGCRHLRSLSDHERLRFSHDRSGRSRR